MLCPNGDCPYLSSRGSSAEVIDKVCPYCGCEAEEEPDTSRDTLAMETIATFREAHEAYLARGALEAEGIPAEVWGEHSASLGYSDTDGTIRLGVPADQVERALETLAGDHTHVIEDRLDIEHHPIRVPTCPKCGSASIQEARGDGIFGIVFELVSGLLGRRWACLTCGEKWRGSKS